MREYGSNINLPSLDNLFSSEQERQDAKLEKIQILPLTKLHPFRNHPFQVRDDDEMDKMVDSVKEYGVMTPAIVRPRKDGGYEIVAGHRRCHASQRAGVETMPCIVRDMDDDTAIILMVDSNCQREHILPSEKAKAYEMKLEAIRRKAGRPSKENSRQVVGDFESADLVGQASGESGRQVQRFIRLNKLTPELMKMVDAAQMQRIQDTFWAMHEITYEVEEVDTTPEPTEDDPDPEQQTDYILHITVSSKTVDELAELYNFTQDQKDILHQLLSEEMRPSLLALCGGIAVADGELCWPLPGHTYISCHFGEVDAFGNAGHRGTDIPAPEGTPILAAHSGTVLVSGWNDSYGNQVLLDNGAGLSTRYAHMTQTAVTAGEAVTAGQIIGYVGSTGDSTGNHLHFEVMQNGVRMNPLELVFAQ